MIVEQGRSHARPAYVSAFRPSADTLVVITDYHSVSFTRQFFGDDLTHASATISTSRRSG